MPVHALPVYDTIDIDEMFLHGLQPEQKETMILNVLSTYTDLCLDPSGHRYAESGTGTAAGAGTVIQDPQAQEFRAQVTNESLGFRLLLRGLK